MSQELETLLSGYEDKYPRRLAESYPRIVARIVELWPRPDLLASYFQELLIMDRPGRQGFPPDIAMEIFSLSSFYDALLAKPKQGGDVWSEVLEKTKETPQKPGVADAPKDFFKSVGSGDCRTVARSLEAGMNVDIRDGREWTPLMVAAFDGNEEMALLLLRYGASVNAHDPGGYTPLHWAALNGYAKVVDLLLGRKANPGQPSRFGLTPLLQAAAKGHVEIVVRLIAAGADVNAATHDGWTPLHKAVANKHRTVAEMLLEHGANPEARHRDGDTPRSIAERVKDPALLALFS